MKRCQALINPALEQNGWRYRCNNSARPEFPFCGVHAWLTEYIVSIKWKESAA